MRKQFIFILLLLAAAGTAWFVHAEKGQGDVSQGSSPAQRELIVNGSFSDGIQGWQIGTTGTKPKYQVSHIEDMPGQALALTADHQYVTYLRQRVSTQTPFVRLQYKANFLSTRGNGHIKLTAYDENNQPLAVLGWVAEGDMPSSQGNEKWYDFRVPRNTLGNWLDQDIFVVEKLKQEFPQLDFKKIREYQIDFIVTDGQHGLFTDVHLLEQNWAELRLQVINNSSHQEMGQDFTIATRVTNTGDDVKQDVLVRALEPYGWGLVVKEPVQKINFIEPGETKVIDWVVTAQRPSTVNLQNPWEIVFQIDGTQSEKAVVIVEDHRPGKVYYVLTDDLEPIDGAGYAKAYGNQNAWLDPEEFQIQLVQKAERLNILANTYGAKWSHYIAWPAVTAARWASEQSKTGAWPIAIKDLERSVQTQSAQGHEYAIHMHSDYDPRFPNAILRYDSGTDGFWANHRRHGWAQNLPELGTPEEVSTRTGSLYYYHSRLTELMRGSGQGQIVATRVGSYDFGDSPTEEGKSIESYRRAGLMAGSDADGNRGGVTAAEYTKNLYFTCADDINKPAGNIGKIGILQFKPTPERYIAYDTDSADILNQKVTEGLAVLTQQGNTVAGIHAIIGFTHAMFIMGEGDWRTLEGGQFAEIDRHLDYVQENFIKQGLLYYATSSELAKAYWDYYTPKLTAVYGPEQRQGWGTFVYPIQLLGSQIPIDTGHIHNVTMKYPLYLRDKAYKIEVRKNGKVIMKTWGLPTPFNDIVFPVDDRTASYTMHVQADERTGKIVKMMRSFWQKIRSYIGKN